jgi:ABC-type bacteriocin/lantibiotic exporter with double-glycine peptidase domain
MLYESNIITQLLTNYFNIESTTAVSLVLLSLTINGIQANGISRITAEIVQSIEDVNRKRTTQVFFYLCLAFLIFLILNNVYKHLQTYILTKLKQWMRVNLLNVLMLSNKEEMAEMNYPGVASPINRAASSSYLFFSSILNSILPNTSFMLVITAYFLFTQPMLGTIFLTGNFIAFLIVYLQWENISNSLQTAIDIEYANELHLLEVLHNFDKIIYRGQTENESTLFRKKTDYAFKKAYELHSNMANIDLLVTIFVTATILFMLWYMIQLYYSKNVTATYFITIVTLLIIYRDKMFNMIDDVYNLIDAFGRSKSVLKHFKDVPLQKVEQTYNVRDLPFHKIEFVNVQFKYKSNITDVVSDMSVAFNTTNHDIIGISGVSGKGKSTIMKILLKIHPPKEGAVYIDGVNIKEISPDYIRKNITYVSQNGKLFDRVVLENIMYGCSHPETCSKELQNVLKYKKVRDLFKNIDMENKKSGNLGENLSGGQRQVVNIIGGLINPSKILVLDEPTNALDQDLKREIMRLIQEYSKGKNAILIISHDKDILPICNRTVKI